MSYIVKYIPELSDLKKQFESNPDIVKYYLKFEGFHGDSESMKFLEEKIQEFLKNNQ